MMMETQETYSTSGSNTANGHPTTATTTKFQSVKQTNTDTTDSSDHEAPPYSSVIPAGLFVIMMIAAFILPAILLTSNKELQIFLSEDDLEEAGYSTSMGFNFSVALLVIGPVLFFVQWALSSIAQAALYVFDGTSYIHNDDDDSSGGGIQVPWYILMIPTRTTLMFHLCILCSMLRYSIVMIMTQHVQQLAWSYLTFGTAVFLFLGWTFALEDGHHALYQYAASIDKFVSSNKKSQKWLTIMKQVGSFQKPATDKAYRYAGYAKSPAYALAGAAGMFVVIGKFLGLALLLFYMIGLDLYKNIFIIGLTAAVALATNAASLNSTIGTLSSLTMSNSIHAGELIALSNSGSQPGHNPGAAVIGFVEGFTWSHIVIRDFKKFQVFIPYQELQSLTLTNWSRRPAKLVSIELSVRPSLSGGAARLAKLCTFVKQWMARHPDLDQDGYTKAIIKYSDEGGPTLQVMFYNRIGHDKNKLRNEFIVMLMDAAQKLDLCLTPAVVQRPDTNWPPGTEEGKDEDDQEESDLQRHLFDLMPSDELTARSGFGEKFKFV